jgi:hypothetical protein
MAGPYKLRRHSPTLARLATRAANPWTHETVTERIREARRAGRPGRRGVEPGADGGYRPGQSAGGAARPVRTMVCDDRDRRMGTMSWADKNESGTLFFGGDRELARNDSLVVLILLLPVRSPPGRTAGSGVALTACSGPSSYHLDPVAPGRIEPAGREELIPRTRHRLRFDVVGRVFPPGSRDLRRPNLRGGTS